MSQDLHPSVKEFKAFLQKHPKLVEEVRKNGSSWQTYYEKWALLGEDDPLWENYKEGDDTTGTKKKQSKSSKTEVIDRLVQLSENVDMEKLQKQAHNINSTITTVQDLLSQFQSNQGAGQQPFRNQPFRGPNHPFGGFRD